MTVIERGVFKDGDEVFIWDEPGEYGVSLKFDGALCSGEVVCGGRDNRELVTPFVFPED